MPTHIISWSGGPDSTYGLLQFLHETDDPVVDICVGTVDEPWKFRYSPYVDSHC